MAQRRKIFIAYCYPDQKWLARVRAAMEPMAPEDFTVWDERKFRAGNSWRAELTNVLAECDLAVMLVSDLFLDSDFVNGEVPGAAGAGAPQPGVRAFAGCL